MDCEGWLALLRRIERREIALVTRELSAPSPLAAEILNARPYAFLDDAPLEERRTQAVLARRWTDPASSDDLGALDAEAIATVHEEAWPHVRDADEMHEALTTLACVTEAEAAAHAGWTEWLETLARGARATRMQIAEHDALWLPVERLACFRAVYPDAVWSPRLSPPKGFDQDCAHEDAVVDVIRARMNGVGPRPVAAIARPLALPASAVATALVRLEREGYAMRGRFTPGAAEEEWCERHLLARIHRYTIRRLRREIEPVERGDYMRFLLHWQRLLPETRGMGRDALAATLEQLEGFEASASAWEEDILPARLADYSGIALDELSRSGKIAWARILARTGTTSGPVRATPIVLTPRRDLPVWLSLSAAPDIDALTPRARDVFASLARHGALFFDELVAELRSLPLEVEQALGELVASGLVNADSFAGLRALLAPAASRQRARRLATRHAGRYAQRGALIGGMDDAGRWALVRRPAPAHDENADRRATTATAHERGLVQTAPAPRPSQTQQKVAPELIEQVAMTLLGRYGVVCWQLLEREAAWLPNWRELLHVLHRLEARGQVRGGRFVAGLSGEQFALPEALALLREVRKRGNDGQTVCISAADPLNLTGTILIGDKVPAVGGNRLLLRDGAVVATLVASRFTFAPELDPAAREQARVQLARRS
jgi:ATP-dependent Lhr-like helicase